MGIEIIAGLGVTIVLLLLGVIAMAFKPLFIKGGKFPNIHIGGSKAMKERGINCATSQDREAQQPKIAQKSRGLRYGTDIESTKNNTHIIKNNNK